MLPAWNTGVLFRVLNRKCCLGVRKSKWRGLEGTLENGSKVWIIGGRWQQERDPDGQFLG